LAREILNSKKEVVKLNVKCFTFAVNSRKKRKIKIAKNKKRII